MRITRKEKALHKIFLAGIIINGIEGIFELVGGLIVAFSKSFLVFDFVQRILQNEIIENPRDFVAGYLFHASQHMPLGIWLFVAIYFIFHGLLKIGLSLGLWHKKTWAYPIAGIILSLFVIYQLIRFFRTGSIIILFLTLVDVMVIILLRSEYKKLKRFHK